jgi:uncharacterized protein (TIGR02246 family)
MSQHGPEQVIEQFAGKLNKRDVEGALALYDDDAAFAPQPGQVVRGKDAIRGAIEAFAALDPRLSGEIEKTVVAGDLALVQNRWSLEGKAQDGSPVRMSGVSADVMRKGTDGAWRIAIDDPWGGGS